MPSHRLLACALPLFLAAPVFAADAPKPTALQAVPVCLVACAPLPDGLDFQTKPFNCKEPGIQVTFMVKDKNLVGVKRNGVAVAKITAPNGTDITQQRNGDPAWNMGAFPKAAPDGSCLFFDVEVKFNDPAVTDAASRYQIDGKATLLMSPGAKKVKKEHLKAGDTFKESGLEIKVISATSVQVSGGLDAVNGSPELTVNGKKTKSDGWFGSDDSRTYTFGAGGFGFGNDKDKGKKPAPAAKADDLTLEFAVWQDIKETVVPFHCGKLPAKKK